MATKATTYSSSELSYVIKGLREIFDPKVEPTPPVDLSTDEPEIQRKKVNAYFHELGTLRRAIMQFNKETLPSLKQNGTSVSEINDQVLSVIEKAEVIQVVKDRMLKRIEEAKIFRRVLYSETTSYLPQLSLLSIEAEESGVCSGFHDEFIQSTFKV